MKFQPSCVTSLSHVRVQYSLYCEWVDSSDVFLEVTWNAE